MEEEVAKEMMILLMSHHKGISFY